VEALDDMLKLPQSLNAWGTPEFEAILKREVAQTGVPWLPLQQGLSVGSVVIDTPITLVLHRVEETAQAIRVKAGVFYQGVIAGCSCADDPTPVGETTEHCVVQLEIDKVTAATAVMLLADE
jgi:hypothetical protein